MRSKYPLIHSNNIVNVIQKQHFIIDHADFAPIKVFDFLQSAKFLFEYLQLAQKYSKMLTLTGDIKRFEEQVQATLSRFRGSCYYHNAYKECQHAFMQNAQAFYILNDPFFHFSVLFRSTGVFVDEKNELYNMELLINVHHIHFFKNGNVEIYGSFFAEGKGEMFLEWQYSSTNKNSRAILHKTKPGSFHQQYFLIAEH